MYNRGNEIQKIVHEKRIIKRVYYMGNIVYDITDSSHTNINPDSTRYIPIEYLSEHFNKDFENDYWYFSLFYNDNGTPATNLFYWKKGDGVSFSQVESVLTVTHDNTVECYNYYNTSSAPNVFNYDVGHDTIPGNFEYNTYTDRATVYWADGSQKWQSDECLGLETNIPIILYADKIYITKDGQVYITPNNEIYILKN
jgi:hypothetical protein